MLDELKEELIVAKVGGRFKLSTLIQKRLIALNSGARALVETRAGNKMELVLREIMEDKIYLDLSGNVKVHQATEDAENPAEGETVDLTQSED